MTYYLYRKQDGRPDLKDYPLNLGLFDGYKLMWSGARPPNIQGMIFSGDVLVRDLREPEWLTSRKAAYPPIRDLADALVWQSMGDDSKLNAYLATCADVKARFPKVK